MTRDREVRLEDTKLEKRQSGGKLITVEKLETGQVKLSRVQIGEGVWGVGGGGGEIILFTAFIMARQEDTKLEKRQSGGKRTTVKNWDQDR